MVTLNRLLALCLAATALPAAAEEGMWTFDAFPAAAVKQAYGFAPTPAFLEAARLGTLKLGSCSAAFVSPDGLLVTNHHCVRTCVQDLASAGGTAGKDYLQEGFWAAAREGELRCDKLEALQLVEMRDVTAQLLAATSGKTGTAYNDAHDAELARLESSCAAGERCEVVGLFRGGRYQLNKYRRYTDLRLVFAPEFAMASFGGDPDNFNFPRYDLDLAFLRAWDPDSHAPVKSPQYFSWAKEAPEEGEPLFVPGYPLATNRLATVAELEFERDVVLPYGLMQYSELRATLRAFARTSPANEKLVRARLRSAENLYKVYRGAQQALSTGDAGSIFAQRRAAEAQLRERVQRDVKLRAQVGSAWEDTARALAAFRAFRTEYRLKELGEGFSTELGTIARQLVRAAEEQPKPNGQRLREYTDARLPALKQQLLRTTPISREVEELTLAVSLTRLRELLGADDPFVQSVLGRDTPEELARRLVRGTRLNDVAVRRGLLEGGKKAVEASKDPMLLLARKVDAEARAVRTRYEDSVQAVLQKSGERLARAWLAVHGNQSYPDATGDLRMSYGTVKGWTEGDDAVEPVTTFWGAYARHTGKPPFVLPRSWLAAQEHVPTETPLNFVSTHDISTGNSGSPVLDRQGRLVGVVFDGNLHSLGDEYGYAAANNRTISMNAQGILVALEQVYAATRLVQELRAGQAAAASGQ